jgi:PAS domain S-box-containing protein
MTRMSQPDKDNQTDYCLWDTSDREFHVGIVGTGPGFMSILDILHNEQYQDFLPRLKLAAVADPGIAANREHVKSLGVPVYETFQEMLAAHPEIDLVVELVGSRFKLKAIRSMLPDNISLIDHNAAFFLCGLHNMLQVSTHCQVDLDQHKALLNAIIDEVRDDIILLDKEGRVVALNKNVFQRIGKPKAELLGLPCWQVQTLDATRPFCCGPDKDCPFFVTLASGREAEAMFTRVDAGGRLMYFRIYSYPIFNPHGHMTHVMVMRRDITRRTYRERHQQQSEKLAVIGEMSMYLAHEIRNPLFAISGFTKSLLESGNLTEKEREKLRIIAEEAKRLDHMLSSVLSFSRQTQTVSGPVDVNRVAEETVELMRIGYADKGYRFVFNPDPNIPRGRGEAETVKQCLVNLMMNSMEAMPRGGEILLRTGMDGDQPVIEVVDRGRGMNQAEMDRVFSPFHTTTGRGYGLGLAMIKKMIEEFGGRVSLASTEGRGTTVTLHFAPILAGEEERPAGGELSADRGGV